MLKTLLNLLTPPRCVCGEILLNEKEHFCHKCWPELSLISSSVICHSCGLPFQFEMGEGAVCSDCLAVNPQFDKARSVFKYNETSGRMITGLKYQDKTPYAKTLAKLMHGKLGELGGQFDVVTSVPIHPKKLLKRKYNQSAILANKIGRQLGSKANNLILKKPKDTNPQASLTRDERIKNIKGAYKVNEKFKSQIAGKSILLVDDVLTTGATASECAKVLKNAGAAKVFVITAARTPIES